jgi:hypothetical protein
VRHWTSTSLGIFDQGAVDAQFGQAETGHLEFEITQHTLPGGDETARAGFFILGTAGDLAQRIVFEDGLHAVGGELALILADEAALGVFHDLKHVVRAERITHHAHRQAADELGLETVVDESPWCAIRGTGARRRCSSCQRKRSRWTSGSCASR